MCGNRVIPGDQRGVQHAKISEAGDSGLTRRAAFGMGGAVEPAAESRELRLIHDEERVAYLARAPNGPISLPPERLPAEAKKRKEVKGRPGEMPLGIGCASHP